MLVAVKASLEDLKDRVAASESAQADLEDRPAAAQTWRACEVFFPRRCERVARLKKKLDAFVFFQGRSVSR